MDTLASSIYTCLALIRRDIHALKKTFMPSFIDGLCVLGAQLILIRYLYPALGMPQQLIAPLYAGILIFTLIHHGFGLALQTLIDLRSQRRIDYYALLPLSKNWLAAHYITRVSLQMIITSLPLVTIGIMVLGDALPRTHLHIPLFIGTYFLTTITCATWFLVSSFHYTYDWFLDHIWQRRLDPLVYTGALMFPWLSIATISPCAGMLALFNPFTYITESLRYALTGNVQYLSPCLCLPCMLALLILGIYCLICSMRTRLDLV